MKVQHRALSAHANRCLRHLQRAALLLLAPAALAAAAQATAGQFNDPAQALVVAVDYLVPEYKGGEKFRSPPTIDTALAEALARRLELPLRVVAAPKDPNHGESAPLRLTTLSGLAAVPPSMAVVPAGYRAAPMAIMRSDTSIRRWDDLRSRSICVARGGNHVGTVAARYAAIEHIHPSVTDALIALRTGSCDAMVHDSPVLEELIRLPEWKKFSARLPAGPRTSLALLVPAEDKRTIGLLQRVTAEWAAQEYSDVLVKKTVRDIAFEVYLEQDVPDCH